MYIAFCRNLLYFSFPNRKLMLENQAKNQGKITIVFTTDCFKITYHIVAYFTRDPVIRRLVIRCGAERVAAKIDNTKYHEAAVVCNSKRDRL